MEFVFEKLPLGCEYEIHGVSSLFNPRSNTVMFITKKHVEKIDNLKGVTSCIVFLPFTEIQVAPEINEKHKLIFVNNPRLAYGEFLEKNNSINNRKVAEYKNINGAMVATTAKIGDNVVIKPFSVIDDDVYIGDGVYIGSGVKILKNVKIGKDCIIGENTVLGSDGLAYEKREDGSWQHIPQLGGLIIEDGVRIGANTVITRGAIEETVIGRGSTIDNSVFISHNVKMGENNSVVGGAVLFGSVSTGNGVTISGNSVIRNGVQVEDNAFIGMGAVVTKNVTKNIVVTGNPARDIELIKHENTALKRMLECYKKDNL